MGNFIFVKPKHNAHEVAAKLEDRNILVHPYGNQLLKDFLRVSTGSRRVMERFVVVFLEVDK